MPIAVVYIIASVVTVVVYAADKSAARSGSWRISESVLHLLAVIGGWPGALIAQRLFHHKSRKVSFQITFWTTVIVNCAALAWYLSEWR